MPFFTINASNTSPVTVATPLGQRKVRLCGAVLSVSNTTTLQFSSGATPLGGPIGETANQPFVLPQSPGSVGSGERFGFVQTNPGEALTLTPGMNTTFSGWASWCEVD